MRLKKITGAIVFMGALSLNAAAPTPAVAIAVDLPTVGIASCNNLVNISVLEGGNQTSNC